MSDIKVFVHKALQEQRAENLFLDQLIKDFKAHKEGQLIPYFGRDAQYLRPRSIADSDILHIHILHESSRAYKIQEAAIKRGHPKDPFGLKCDMDMPEHDKALVYTRGFMNKDCYYILDFFDGNAHETAENMDIMLKLAKIAEKFRESH